MGVDFAVISSYLRMVIEALMDHSRSQLLEMLPMD